MRERLEELNWRTPPRSLNSGDHGKAVKVFDSKPEVVARTLISLAQSGRRLLKANGACCEYPDAIPQAMKITLEDALSVLRKYAEERTPVLAAFVTPSVSVARVTGAIRVSTVAEDGESDQIKFRLSDCEFQYGDFREASAEDSAAHKFEGFLVVGSKGGDTLSLFEIRS